MDILSEEQLKKYLIQAYNEQSQELSFLRVARPQDWPYVLKSRDWTKIKRFQVQCERLKYICIYFVGVALTREIRFRFTFIYSAKNYYKLRSPGIKKLIKQGNSFSKLTYLNLWDANIGSIGAKHVTKINMPNIQNLRMGYCYITNEGMKHIVKGNWPKIQKLQLSNNLIHNCNIHYLSETDWGTVTLNLTCNDIGFSCLLTFAIMKSSKNLQYGRGFYCERKQLREEIKKIQETRSV